MPSRFAYVLLSLILSCVCMTMAFAQDDSQPPAAANPDSALGGFNQRGIKSETYKLYPGDVISIEVLGMDNLKSDATVSPDGMINLALLSPIKAAGMTAEELQKTLTESYKVYLKSPVVRINVRRFHQSVAQVIGLVKNPGSVPVEDGFIFTDYIAYAGGYLPNADMTKIILIRLNGDKLVVDASSKTNPQMLPAVKEGDIISVPEMRGNISALGKVNKPGTIDYKRGMRVSDAVTLAGGALADGDLTQVVIISEQSERKVNLAAFLEKADDTQNPEIAPGDRIYVPESTAKIYIFGAVQKSGAYVAKNGERMMDAILRAGGFSQTANPKSSGVVRQENGAPRQIEINLTDFMKKGNLNNNPVLMPGDLVYVSERSGKNNFWNSASQILIPFNTLFTILR